MSLFETRIKVYELKTAEDLRAYPNNPRTITDKAKEGLKYSVESFGDISGIVWNKRTGHLVCGHQRVKVLQEAGAVFNTDGGAGPPMLILGSGECFEIRVVDWDEDKEAAANLAANNEEISGDWTTDVAALVEKAGAGDIDIGELRIDILSDRFTPPTDPYEEWSGMPEYENEDLSSHRKVIVHFANEDDAQAFARLIGQELTDKTKVIWFPEQKRTDHASLEYAEEP